MIRRILLLVFFLVSIYVMVFVSSGHLHSLLLQIGYDREEITISGTGSMYPTFPKGSTDSDITRASEIVAWPKMREYPSGFTVLGTTFFSHPLERGDIIEFDNEKTESISKEKYGRGAGFVKRLVALPGDTVLLKDGYLYRNGVKVTEPYIARPRSTYGGENLPDCTSMYVPAGSVFVLGDNRKASLDSRFSLGLVSISDIHYVLPWSEQSEYRTQWRDTTYDDTYAHTATIDPVSFMSLVNKKRSEKNLKPLVYNAKLSDSAKKRGVEMLASSSTDDQGSHQVRDAHLRQSIESSGYYNIIYSELFTRGFFDADELVENFLAFPDTTALLYTTDYQDIGISPVVGDVKECPSQFVVVHFGGYKPPVYTASEITAWESLKKNIDDVLPSWEQLQHIPEVDQTKLSNLLDLLRLRQKTANLVLTRMKNTQWLNAEEKKLVEGDKERAEQAERIINDLSKNQ